MTIPSYLHTFVKQVPQQPGVYQFLDRNHKILYIGKAKRLKSRLRNYLQSHLDIKTLALVQKIEQCILTVTQSEEEALIVEQKLIRKYKPPYNILLKDDKSYPYLVLTKHDFFQIKTHRGSFNPALHLEAFGPFPSTELAQNTLEILTEIFQLRTCSDHTFMTRNRPCLQYQIKRCSAPCVGLISKKDYNDALKKVRGFLKSTSSEVVEFLIKKMQQYSDSEQFEKANFTRTHIERIRSLQRQSLHSTLPIQRVDIVAFQWPFAHHIMIAGTEIVSSRFHQLKTVGEYSPQESLEGMLNYIYSPLSSDWLPQSLVTNCQISSKHLNILGHTVSLIDTKHQSLNKYIDMANESLWQNIQQVQQRKDFFVTRFKDLQQQCAFKSLRTIDCLDISHISGQHTLGAVVRVSQQEGFDKSAYRRYIIPSEDVKHGDDYHSVYLTTLRHLKQCHKREALPSLLLIDGGKGQLSSAALAAQHCSIDIPIWAIAKGEGRRFGLEKIYRLSEQDDTRFEQIDISPLSPAFALLGRLRDEAHRFAITAVRKKVSKSVTQSPLDQVPGIGHAKKKRLLEAFGGWQGLQKASYEQILQVQGFGPRLAKELVQFLKKF